MPSEKKLEQLIRLLIRETTEGQISWEASNPPRSRMIGTDDIIADYFETTFKDQEVAVFERRYKEFNPENESLYWTSDYCFALLSGGAITWETEDSRLLFPLFKVAKESAADVDGILDKLLE
jgi:hypothetical protein